MRFSTMNVPVPLRLGSHPLRDSAARKGVLAPANNREFHERGHASKWYRLSKLSRRDATTGSHVASSPKQCEESEFRHEEHEGARQSRRAKCTLLISRNVRKALALVSERILLTIRIHCQAF